MLKTVLLEEEYRQIPEHLVPKIDKVLIDASEQYLNLSALFETFKRDQAELLDDVQTRLAQEINKRESIELELTTKSKELEELDTKVGLLQKQNLQLKNDLARYESEARTYRTQRDEFADEKSSLEAILNRRTNELESLKSDYDSINEKLRSAVQAKIEALTQLNEIQSKKIELDFKEKRLEKEKELLHEQINLLTNDVTKHNNDVITLKRQHSSQLITIQAELQRKTEEIKTLLENEENYKRTIESLNQKIEELNDRLTGRSEVENELRNQYIAEIDSRTKLADVYKEMSEDSNKKAEELASTAKELQKLLAEAETQYKDLEKRYIANESTYKEQLQKKTEAIAILKKELFDANNLIDVLKKDHLNDALENLSPHAAAAYNIMRKGLTLTQIYTEYANVSEQLMIKTHDNEQLQETFKSFIEELEGKAHILRKRNEDYAEAMATLEKITQNYDQLELEFETMKAKYDDAERNQARLTRDNERLQKTVSDLSRQVCFLLKEVEESRGGEILIRSISDTSDCLTSADVISKKLVTFHDIQELQENNIKLLSSLRDLSEEFEKAEMKLKSCNKEDLENKIANLENTVSEKNDAIARQEKIIHMFKNQLNMYKMLGNDKLARDRSCGDSDAISDVPMIEMGNTKVASIQTSGSEIESIHCAELQKELNAKNREITKLKSELESCNKEHSINEKMMLESLEKAEKSYQKLSHDYKSLISRSENTQEKCKCLKLTVGSLKAEITALENKCKTYSQTIGKHEQTINVLREEAMNAMSALSRNEVLLENAKRECSMLRESEARLAAERDVLKQDKQNHAYLLSNIESIKASIERSESEWKMKIEEKWNTAEKECSALRRRLQDEQDRFNEKVVLLEKSLETAKNRLEEEKKSNIELSNMVKSLKDDIDEKNKVIDDLKNKLKTSSSESVAEMELLMKNLQNKYQQALKEIEHQKELLEATKKDAGEITKLSENFESLLVAERETHVKYKKEMEAKVSELAGEVAGLRKQNNNLQKRVNELTNLNQTSMINLNDELMEEKRKYSSVVEEMNIIKQQLAAAQAELKAAVDAKLIAEKKYTDEMLQHTEDIKELKNHIDMVITLKNTIAQLTNERDAALLKAECNANNNLEQEKRIQEEIDGQRERMKDLIQQNELLLNQIQELSLKLSIKQSNNSMDEGNTSTISEDGERNTDNLLQVISYLKREKNLATSQLETLLSENRRLKSEIDLIKSQFEETRSLLEAEQQKTDISTTTAARHAELINKVQTLNALSDSNRVLREERDRYAAELSEIKDTLEKIESKTLIPLRNENKQMSSQLETLQTENMALQKECSRWRTRVTEMTEKINKNNAEDLQKSLNMERDAHNKTLEDLRAVKQEKSKLEDQLKKTTALHSRITALEKERNDLQKERSDLQKELSEEKTKNTKVNQDFEELQKTFAAHETVINDLKNSNIQVRSIARKYKSQCQELNKQIEEVKKKPVEAQVTPAEVVSPPVAEISAQEQDRLRQEGRQQVEAETNDRIKQLSDQLTSNQSDIDRLQGEIERLLTENKALHDTVQEKEVRATDILKTARARILSLTRETKKCQEENESLKEQIKHIESTREEGIARQNVIKSTYENRISKLEKEKTDSQTDRERLVRENEILSQKVSLLQRQLNTQQGVKSAANSGQEKGSIEPPTANIKPLAGPSSSVAKSQQNQQSVAVTPWRSGNETPFASIRPMSMQTRTAAVLPTSQTSCSSASQSAILVPPQQQLVDTSSNAPSIVEAFSSSPSSSSHTDYNMPSTSSSVSHMTVRQVVVTPTQQTSHSAESTQDMEAECGNQELQSQASLSSQQQSSQVSQNQSSGILTVSSIMAAPSVSQSQTPTVALVLPRIDLQNLSGPSHMSNVPEQSMVASSQTMPASLVSASNQTDSSNAQKRTETYYQQDGEDSNPGQVSASNQHSQQQAVVASSIETAPEQSIIIASSQQSNDKNMSEPSVASSNANSSNTVTTTQAGLKRSREMEGESSKSSCSTEVNSVQPKAKRSRRMETVHEEIFRNDIDEASNTDMLLRYGGIDVEYQVPTSSQRDQEFDNLGIDSEAEDELEEDEQAMPDDGIIDENDDVQEYVEDEEEVESEEVYEIEGYDREEQDTPINRYTALEGPDIDEEGVQVHDQDNEVEILDEGSSEVPNQSGRSDSTATITARRNLEQQSSEATSSGNNLRAQSASITSNQSSITLQFNRRPSTISPLNRQQNQPLLLSQGFEENAGDDSIVPSTPTLCVPRRTDGFGEAVSSPHVPSGGRFTFSESNPPGSRAGVAQMVSEGIDDTRMDLSQLEENASTGRSVPSTPLQSSPQEIERIEIGQSIEDGQQLSEELSSNSNQQQQPVEDILLDNVTYHADAPDNELEITNESENLIDEPAEPGRDENNDGVTSDSGQSDPQVAGTSQNREDDLEEGREAEAVTKNSDLHSAPQQIPTTGGTARRIATRSGRSRRSSPSVWEPATISNPQESGSSRGGTQRGPRGNPRGPYRRPNRRRSWTQYPRY